MNKKTGRIALLALCVMLSAFSLTGCFGIVHDVTDVVGDIARDSVHTARDITEDILKNSAELGGDIVSQITENIPDVEDMLKNDLEREDRKLTSYEGKEITEVRLCLRGADSVGVSYGDGDGFEFEYDAAHFTVRTEEDDGVLTLTVTSPSGLKHNGKYRAYVRLPKRIGEKLDVDCRDSGLILLGLEMPVKLNADDAGIAIENCTGDLDLRVKDVGFSLGIPQLYQGNIALDCENAGAAVYFMEREPDDLAVSIQARDSAVSGRLGDSGFMTADDYTYQKGDGSTKVTIAAKDCALSIGTK